MDAFELKLNDSLRKGETVVFGVNCSVRYSGRAESFLEQGDRIVIIKEDGTLLIHQPQGSYPVNYMKSGTSHFLEKRKDGLFLVSRNLSEKEFLELQLFKVYFISSRHLVDGKKILLQGTERDMSRMIMSNPELIEKGFRPLSEEEHTEYGFIDVFGYDSENRLVVVECKRYSADLSAVQQLRRYVERVMKSKGLPRNKVRGIIAAPKISPKAEKMLRDFGFEYRKVSPPKYFEKYDSSQASLDSFA